MTRRLQLMLEMLNLCTDEVFLWLLCALVILWPSNSIIKDAEAAEKPGRQVEGPWSSGLSAKKHNHPTFKSLPYLEEEKTDPVHPQLESQGYLKSHLLLSLSPRSLRRRSCHTGSQDAFPAWMKVHLHGGEATSISILWLLNWLNPPSQPHVHLHQVRVFFYSRGHCHCKLISENKDKLTFLQKNM